MKAPVFELNTSIQYDGDGPAFARISDGEVVELHYLPEIFTDSEHLPTLPLSEELNLLVPDARFFDIIANPSWTIGYCKNKIFYPLEKPVIH